MHANQSGNLHLLVQVRFFTIKWVDVGAPLHCFIRNFKALENAFVEAVLTQQQFMNALQEHAAFGTLNDAVVVRTRDCDNL